MIDSGTQKSIVEQCHLHPIGLGRMLTKHGGDGGIVDRGAARRHALRVAVGNKASPAYSPGCVNGRSLPFWEGSSAA